MSNEYFYEDEDITSHYTCNLNPVPAHFRMHIHEACEFLAVFRGKGQFRVEGTSYPLEAGDVLIMRPAEAHFVDVCPDEPYERMAIQFHLPLFSHIDRDGWLSQPFLNREAGRLNRYRAEELQGTMVPQLLQSMIAPCVDRRMHLLSGLLPILEEIASVFHSRSEEPTADTLDYQITSYINRHLRDDLSLDVICREFFISKPQLCHLFKNATGSTVWEYITAKRLVTARELILSGTPPTKAYGECGFGDYSVFYRAYKKKYGTSPSERQ